MTAHAHLRIVDPDTGEFTGLDDCPNCAEKDDTIRGLERDIRGWTVRYAQLKREKDAEARAHEAWPKLLSLFATWRKLCNHPRSKFTTDRFWEALTIFQEEGEAMCELALEGAKFDPYVTQRKNGTKQRHDDWELIFRDRKRFESFVNRAPLEARERLLKVGRAA